LANETHLGSSIYPSHFVTLRLLAGAATEIGVFKRMLSDGTFDPDEFVVPHDQVLIITDIEIKSHMDPMNVELRINGQTVYFQRAEAASTSAYPIFPRTGEHFTAGIVVPMGKKLDFAGYADVFVRGYLTKNR